VTGTFLKLEIFTRNKYSFFLFAIQKSGVHDLYSDLTQDNVSEHSLMHESAKHVSISCILSQIH